MNDLKEGPGKFIYKTRKQIYEGEWALGSPKCGSLKDMGNADDVTITGHLPIPPVLFCSLSFALFTHGKRVL